MELHAVRALSNLPRLFNPSSIHLPRKTPLLLSPNWVSGTKVGLAHFSSLKARTSEETSSGFNQYPGEERDGVIAMKDVSPVEKSVYSDSVQTESTNEESPMAEQTQGIEFLDKLNIKLDSEDAYSILLYGSGALVAVWLASAVVGAIDSIPVVCLLTQIHGIGGSCLLSLV
ncbi:protein CURVATURE THYLAKOID 1D, chloroplastic isoform X2 [Malania oleifera]|uniref:protein CURVATURE THYLAKOID 1D, chloroplastic isoform X2 n=1 Tax=Malania oleifera TaxID=397392 RepID=UPI0025ADE761|nr:protein CURVATURE THYLAKOID 1D, chloroplastic isoform X2 [Malania oleifera]